MSTPNPDSMAEFLAVAQEMTQELGRQHQEQLAVMRLSANSLQKSADDNLARLAELRKQAGELAKSVPQLGQAIQTSLRGMAGEAGQAMAKDAGRAFGQATRVELDPTLSVLRETASRMESQWRSMYWSVVGLAVFAVVGMVLGTWLHLDMAHDNKQLRQQVSDYAAAYQTLKAEKSPKAKAPGGARE